MRNNDISYMNIPELLDTIRSAADELQLRCMEEAGETPRMICGDTGKTCVWCRANCEDRRTE